MKRLLIFRGGALGDFILTLPTLRTLREAFPAAEIHLVANKAGAVLAERRFYANSVRSIDDARLGCFFVPGAALDPDWRRYLSSFETIITYLSDPTGVFARNLERCGGPKLLTCSPTLSARKHAAVQLGAPLSQLGLRLGDPAASLFPTADDKCNAATFLEGFAANFISLHPGSGSERKNWPLERWIALGERLMERHNTRLLVVGGEADAGRIATLRRHWDTDRVRFAVDLPLPILAAALQGHLFLGHDSGISHLAAAAGGQCVLLFGPTNPMVWAPQNAGTEIVAAPDGDLSRLPLDQVWSVAERRLERRPPPNRSDYELMRIGIRT